MTTPLRVSPNTILDGRYRVERTLSGGKGIVYVCRDLTESSPNLIAVKTLLLSPSEAGSRQARALEADAEAWIRLCDGFDSFHLELNRVVRHDGQVFLVMPYCPNGSLRERMRDGPMAGAEAVGYATQILMGLWQLEVRGVAHRNLKPENVLFDASDSIRLADFGLARFIGQELADYLIARGASEELTTTGGTLPYMAPEQLIGIRGWGAEIDMWAFGVLVIEMLTGTRPFERPDAKNMVHAIIKGRPGGLDRIDRRLPFELKSILRQLLQKNPTHRFATVRELVMAWDEVIRVEHSPAVSGLLKRDRRIAVTDPLVTSYWNDVLFPDRSRDEAKMTFVMSVSRALRDCQDFYELDNYEATIKAADDILGNSEDPASQLSQFLLGTLGSGGEFIAEPEDANRLHISVGAADVLEALEWRLKAMVGLLSYSRKSLQFASHFHSYAKRLLSAPDLPGRLAVLVAEALGLQSGRREGATAGRPYGK